MNYDFQVGDIVCVPGEGNIHPFPTGYISKETRFGNYIIVFENQPGELAQPYKPEALRHREVDKAEMMRPSEYRETSNGTLVKIKCFPKRIGIYVETNMSIKIDGKERTIKADIFVNENDILEFVKNREKNSLENSDDWQKINEIRILSVKIERRVPVTAPQDIDDIIGWRDE